MRSAIRSCSPDRKVALVELSGFQARFDWRGVERKRLRLSPAGPLLCGVGWIASRMDEAGQSIRAHDGHGSVRDVHWLATQRARNERAIGKRIQVSVVGHDRGVE